jgi:hypothetical protein
VVSLLVVVVVVLVGRLANGREQIFIILLAFVLSLHHWIWLAITDLPDFLLWTLFFTSSVASVRIIFSSSIFVASLGLEGTGPT